MSIRLRFLVAGTIAALLAGSAPAIGAPLDRREVQARKDFAAGRYDEAADAFADLFARTGDPIYLRNIARCYQKLKKPAEAISSFEDYLRKARSLSGGEREEIQSYIKEMQALQAAQQPPPPAAPVPVVVAPSAGAPGPDSSTGAAAGAELTAAPAQATTAQGGTGGAPDATASSHGGEGEASRSFRVAGITTGIAGIALLGTGLGFGLAAKSASDANGGSGLWDPERDRAGKRYETFQWVGYGLGAAALGTGVLLYLYGRATADKPPAQSARLELRSALARTGGAVVVEGRF